MKQKNTNYLRYIKPKNAFLWMALLFIFMGIGNLGANNIQVSNVSLVDQDVQNDYTYIKFDLSWDNSWKSMSTSPGNFDAAWVFVKYRKLNSTVWQHASLYYGSNSANHIVPSNAVIDNYDDIDPNASPAPPSMSKGAFIFHSGDMTQGSVTYTNIKLRWEYGLDGLNDNDSVEVSVTAIEMVYIPGGEHYVGSGGNETAPFHDGGSSYAPIKVHPQDDGMGTIILYFGPNVGEIDFTGRPSASTFVEPYYPYGINAFWMMKYEISQEQYVDFLNKLTPTQAAARFPNKNGLNRHNISFNSSQGEYSTTTPYIACNYLSADDLEAYLDWAALRPMSELEFEKANRGLGTPWTDACAWGTDSIASLPYSISNAGSNNESISNNYTAIKGNVAYANTIPTSINGPLRCGIFASNSANTGRRTSGGSYYGVMELSGNVAEYVVSVLMYAYSRHLHGDGDLTSAGATDISWPAMGTRGGAWNTSALTLRISDRSDMGSNYTSARSSSRGGRGVKNDEY